jgi:hypothetical protein
MAHFALVLPGWERQSIWGLDPHTGSLFAQLTRSENDDGNGPDHWISGAGTTRKILLPEMLALMICRATGASPDAVAEAMNKGLEPFREEWGFLRLKHTPGTKPPPPEPLPEEKAPLDGLGPYRLMLGGWSDHSEWGWGIGLGGYWVRLRADGAPPESEEILGATGSKITHTIILSGAVAWYTKRPHHETNAAINHAIDHQRAPEEMRIPAEADNPRIWARAERE